MKERKQNNRQHERHQSNGVLVVSDNNVGQVLDLSCGGVSIGFTSDKQFPETWTADLLNDSGVHIQDIPVEVVWLERSQPSSSIHVVQVGAKFQKGLDPGQQEALQVLLTFYREEQS